MTSPAVTFDEIRAVAQSLPESIFTPPLGTSHPRIVLYAATHGIAASRPGGSAEAMARLVDELVDSHGPLHELVALADSDLKLYDLALDRPTRDSRQMQAIDEIEASRAAAYGMMAVEPGIDIFVTAALGAGAELAGLALARALLPGDAPAGDLALIGPALDRHGKLDDPLELLAALGGPDIAAILGVILAGRLAGIPVILDGIAAFAAAAVAYRLRRDSLAHCRFATAEVAGFSPKLLGMPRILTGASETPLSGARALVAVMG
jgi:nicotinate-nucleotide--dimethylbenzimidazole phosphoribosyltransferase